MKLIYHNINIMIQLVKFDTAKLAKEKGFENTTPHKLRRDYYNHLGKLNGDVTQYVKAFVHEQDTTNLSTIDAPTQSVLQRWLRESCKIEVCVMPAYSSIVLNVNNWLENAEYLGKLENAEYICFVNDNNINAINDNIDNYVCFHDTYEEALEHGLYAALNLIK